MKVFLADLCHIVWYYIQKFIPLQHITNNNTNHEDKKCQNGSPENDYLK